MALRLPCTSVTKLAIQAGPHERVYRPVPVPAVAEGVAALHVAGHKHHRHSVPLQQGEDRLWCVLPYLAADATDRAEAAAGEGVASDGVLISDRGKHLEVRVDGALMPLPLLGVSGGFLSASGDQTNLAHEPRAGRMGFRDACLAAAGGVPGEETHQVHHRSLWVAHGAVNGVDFRARRTGTATRCTAASRRCRAGRRSGASCSGCWRRDDPATGAPVLEERRSLTF